MMVVKLKDLIPGGRVRVCDLCIIDKQARNDYVLLAHDLNALIRFQKKIKVRRWCKVWDNIESQNETKKLSGGNSKIMNEGREPVWVCICILDDVCLGSDLNARNRHLSLLRLTVYKKEIVAGGFAEVFN